MPQKAMDKSSSERIQSSQDKNGGDMSSGGFAARAQSAGDKNSNASNNMPNAGNNTASRGSGGKANYNGK